MEKNYFIIIMTSMIIITCDLYQDNYKTREINDDEAELAIDYATSKIDYPYVWGGNGPEEFDCSGLIVWSYKEALGRNNIFLVDDESIDDVNMDMLYEKNTRHIKLNEVIPGDIIFITYSNDSITHGGLVTEIRNESIKFINASSYYNKIVIDEWELTEIVRDQWIEGFGRLIILD